MWKWACKLSYSLVKDQNDVARKEPKATWGVAWNFRATGCRTTLFISFGYRGRENPRLRRGMEWTPVMITFATLQLT